MSSQTYSCTECNENCTNKLTIDEFNALYSDKYHYGFYYILSESFINRHKSQCLGIINVCALVTNEGGTTIHVKMCDKSVSETLHYCESCSQNPNLHIINIDETGLIISPS